MKPYNELYVSWDSHTGEYQRAAVVMLGKSTNTVLLMYMKHMFVKYLKKEMKHIFY